MDRADTGAVDEDTIMADMAMEAAIIMDITEVVILAMEADMREWILNIFIKYLFGYP